MGCSSCGQRYRAARSTTPPSARILARQALSLKRRNIMASEPGTSPSAGTIQPQPLQGELAPVIAPALDPATGHELSVIKSGTCAEYGSLGDTTLAPIAAEEGYSHEAAESTAKEASEHAAGGEEANG
jgi:hypothetical protein